MARPFKQGVDYFPRDVDLALDRKFRRPKEKYGYLAVGIYEELISLIYKDKGYYMDYSEENQEDVQFDILDRMRGKHQPTIETIGKVIEELVAVGLFSTELWDQNIIASHRQQCNYYKITSDRKNVSIDWSKWLLTKEEMEELGSSCQIYKKFINRPNNLVNHPNNSINRPNNPQSKVKESKVKEINNKPGAKCSEQIVAVLPLKDGTDYELTESVYNEYLEAYPDIDIMAELRKMWAWLNSNPNNKKTRRGIRRFINGWLNKQSGNTPKDKKEVTEDYYAGGTSI